MRALLPVLALLLTSSASAAPILYTSQSAFNAATTTTTYTFPAAGVNNTPVAKPYVDGPITFSDSSGTFFIDTDMAYSTPTYFDDLFGSSLSLSFAPTTALGLTIGTFDAADTLTFNVGGSTFVAMTPAARSAIFIGFTSTTPFSSISITDTDLETDIIRFQYGVASTAPTVTPEPSSIVLLGTGLAGVAGVLRRRLTAR